MKKIKNNEKGVSRYVKFSTQLSFKIDFQKLSQHTKGKWLIHGRCYMISPRD